ncbi:TPA: hypothetical protein ACNIHU_001451 [Pseudomonas aeruginosa]|nr:hypothetical protein [Pseudomonas aeruginosa]MCS8145818.1 hypothetical protein [Pseudomonas aeruginosa]MDP5919024.1 hypothetical protein [Pseudomonas aeruginosa]MDU0618956.1 hypothetical protein [Pseudomonas aeruginosa]MDV7939427.1 hypothetical protein [Pseudomonas aeruginosa]
MQGIVKLAGIAGEEAAPDVMEDWMTGAEVARSRRMIKAIYTQACR